MVPQVSQNRSIDWQDASDYLYKVVDTEFYDKIRKTRTKPSTVRVQMLGVGGRGGGGLTIYMQLYSHLHNMIRERHRHVSRTTKHT